MIKLWIVLIVFLFGSLQSVAQSDTITIKTSAQCEMCKKTIEHELNFAKGIKSAVLDVETKEVVIIYNAKKTDANELRKVISNVGYDADALPANPKAYDKLHECCKKDGHSHD